MLIDKLASWCNGNATSLRGIGNAVRTRDADAHHPVLVALTHSNGEPSETEKRRLVAILLDLAIVPSTEASHASCCRAGARSRETATMSGCQELDKRRAEEYEMQLCGLHSRSVYAASRFFVVEVFVVTLFSIIFFLLPFVCTCDICRTSLCLGRRASVLWFHVDSKS